MYTKYRKENPQVWIEVHCQITKTGGIKHKAGNVRIT
jgi:hypothetical protein